LRPAIIEKDYYVTEALRIIATIASEHLIFKSGTSLAQAAERCSEVDMTGWGLMPGNNAQQAYCDQNHDHGCQ